MLGFIRFFLSFFVIAFHLTQYLPNLGLLSVNFFYVISGYLITLVLQESYKFEFAPFFKNRFLRLYPAYFVLAVVSLVFSVGLESYSIFHPSWSSYWKIGDYFGNAFVFPWAVLSDPLVHVNSFGWSFFESESLRFRLIPSTWSVGVEIVCYLILWLIAARSLLITLISVVVSIVWHAYVVYMGLQATLIYMPVAAAMLPFCLGALAYHLSVKFHLKPLSAGKGALVTLIVLTVFLVNWHLSIDVPFLPSVYYYFNTILAFLTVLFVNRSRHHGMMGTADKWLGDLAYPMFLGHYVFAFVGWRLLGMSTTPVRGTEVFMIGLVLTILGSIAIVLLVDRKVSNVRDRVRTSIGKEGLYSRGVARPNWGNEE